MKNYKNTINASSMADIAFLLLIFFLVTTTINQDKGILNKLPSLDQEEKKTAVLDKNVLALNINALGQIMLEGKIAPIGKVKEFTRKHVLNFGNDPNFSDSPKEAVVLLESDRGSSYDLYIQIQNELKSAYNEIRNEQSLSLSNGAYSYNELNTCIEKATKDAEKCKTLKTIIKKDFPMILLEK